MTEQNEIQVLNRAVRLLQPPEGGFRTSLDSVMLAAACPAQAGERVLDMGCGVGGAAFCLARRVPGILLTGIDIQADYIELANQNRALNPHAEAHFIHRDIMAFEAVSPRARFDHIICNPPYFEHGDHMASPNDGRATALGHRDEEMSLEHWIDCAFRLLQSQGSVTFIHRAGMLDRLLQGFGRRFGAVEIVPLWPRAGQAAKRIVVRAIKDRRSPATMHAGLILHEKDGAYSAAADAILRDAGSLAL